MTDRYELSRRKTLAGLATIGAAGAGAGLGTSALFSDEETFEDNLVAAGELNMQVAAHVRDQNDPLPMVELDSGSNPQDTADGNAVTITASDLKPGDWFVIQWDVVVCSNPAYVQVTSLEADFENEEGDTPDSETGTSEPGDLGDALLTSVWHSYAPTSNGDTRSELGDLDPTTDRENSGLESYQNPDEDGDTGAGAHYTTTNEAHDVYADGVTLTDQQSGDPLTVGCQDGNGATYFQLFELPTAVGNEIQGDALTFTLRFNAEQVRNNPAPFQ